VAPIMGNIWMEHIETLFFFNPGKRLLCLPPNYCPVGMWDSCDQTTH
jgi:hypothetical protein